MVRIHRCPFDSNSKRGGEVIVPLKERIRSMSAEQWELVTKNIDIVTAVVASLARNYPAHTDFNELVAVGRLGLIEAAKNFDKNRGFKFMTYANPRIRGAVLDYLREIDWASRLIRKVEKDLLKLANLTEQETGKRATLYELSDILNVPASELSWVINEIERSLIISLDKPAYPEWDEENKSMELIDTISDENPDSLEEIAKERLIRPLKESIKMLNQQERTVLKGYYYNELTLLEIGNKMRLSESRISQIHTRAIRKLREVLGVKDVLQKEIEPKPAVRHRIMAIAAALKTKLEELTKQKKEVTMEWMKQWNPQKFINTCIAYLTGNQKVNTLAYLVDNYEMNAEIIALLGIARKTGKFTTPEIMGLISGKLKSKSPEELLEFSCWLVEAAKQLNVGIKIEEISEPAPMTEEFPEHKVEKARRRKSKSKVKMTSFMVEIEEKLQKRPKYRNMPLAEILNEMYEKEKTFVGVARTIKRLTGKAPHQSHIPAWLKKFGTGKGRVGTRKRKTEPATQKKKQGTKRVYMNVEEALKVIEEKYPDRTPFAVVNKIYNEEKKSVGKMAIEFGLPYRAMAKVMEHLKIQRRPAGFQKKESAVAAS